MPYERVVPASGRLYSDDVIECDDVLYESVDALVLDVHRNPDEYGITVHREIAGIYFLTDPSHRWGTEIVVFTVCDECPDDDDDPEDYPPCGAYDPEGKWWCGWHDDLSLTWKSKSIVTVIK